MANKNTSEKKGGAKMALGAGIAALTAAAVAYFLVGPEGKKNRKKLQGWIVRMKGEILEKLEQVKHITQPTFDKVVNQVAAKYSKMKHISPADVQAAVTEIKKQWKSIVKESEEGTSSKKKKQA